MVSRGQKNMHTIDTLQLLVPSAYLCRVIFVGITLKDTEKSTWLCWEYSYYSINIHRLIELSCLLSHSRDWKGRGKWELSFWWLGCQARANICLTVYLVCRHSPGLQTQQGLEVNPFFVGMLNGSFSLIHCTRWLLVPEERRSDLMKSLLIQKCIKLN